jgi:hypothetical protein
MIAAIYARKSIDDSDRNEEARWTARQVTPAMEAGVADHVWELDEIARLAA